MAAVFDAPQPLRAWWDLASDPRGTGLFVELVAAANHRPALKAEVGKVARAVRRMQIGALAPILDDYGLDPLRFPPALIAATMQGLAFGLVTDEMAGYQTATKDVRRATRQLLDSLESRRTQRADR